MEENENLGEALVDAIHRYLDRELVAVVARRRQSGVQPDRNRLKELLGIVDPVEPGTAERVVIGGSPQLSVERVRWPVWANVSGEGLLLTPRATPVATVIVAPDADVEPEMICGLDSTLPHEAQYARRIAESGCRVLVLTLINRADTWSGSKAGLTNQPHREFLWRMAFELGRHIIGYEVSKLIAAVDWLAGLDGHAPVAVAGYGEGGLLAFYAAAVEPRLAGALVGGYFQAREEMWREPLYRHVWGLLREFGDAEIAGLIAPRALVVADFGYPAVEGPRPETEERRGAAPGRIGTPDERSVRTEFQRAAACYSRLEAEGGLSLVPRDAGRSQEAAIGALFRGAKIPAKLAVPGPPVLIEQPVDRSARQKRQFEELVAHTQRLARRSELARASYWSRADSSSEERWRQTTQPYREYFWERVIGRLRDPSEPLTAATRLLFDEPAWKGYQVRLPVWPDFPAHGILLVPKNIRPGERRPVVVCQHGGRGQSRDLILADNQRARDMYHSFGARLADRGFVVYAPQSPFIGPEFLGLLRKARPLGLTMYSFTIGMHQRVLEWLASLEYADAGRIGFYGFSYGGKEAMRIPAVLTGYALSICSADFSDWLKRAIDLNDPSAYTLGSKSWDIPCFNMSNTFGYADLAGLLAP
ncbi:MAG: hypothetical protein NTY38_27715, partial [Acidobacteria bacterium]|nr:hypothetical protein [Acidobacteriota bacterium]